MNATGFSLKLAAHLMTACLVVGLGMGCERGIHKRSMAVERAFRTSVDPKLLQDWAMSVIQTNGNIGYELPEAQWPSFIKLTNDPPTSVFLSALMGKKVDGLVICWGGGFGHSGLVVG